MIYCRRSSDDGSDKQVASIPRQIEECLRYAERENLIIKKKPKNFQFETEEEIKKEDNDKDLDAIETYQKSRNLFIIKESASAKQPRNRKKMEKTHSNDS